MVNETLRVTFDKNTYEYVVCQDKNPSQLDEGEKNAYLQIRNAIKNVKILPFISETILTLEAIDPIYRKKVLSRKVRLLGLNSNIEELTQRDYLSGVESTTSDHFSKYLPLAINLGFKILPSYRIGKIGNPIINPNWYYCEHENASERFSELVRKFEKEGFGFSALKITLGINEVKNKPWFHSLDKHPASPNLIRKLVAEWCDVDSIAIHIAHDFKLFCTKDGASRDKSNSIFGKRMRAILKKEYDVEFVTPIELSKLL